MLAKSSQYTLILEGDQLVVSGGADESYLLDELDGEGARSLAKAWSEDRLDAVDGGSLGPVIAKLERLGAILRGRPRREGVLRYGLRSAPPSFAAALSALPSSEAVVRDDEAPELLVWIRTNETLLGNLPPDYASLRTPHLFVDLAYHHTISIGPLVWPGETACIGCLGGRIRQAWGDPPPPPAPRAVEHAPLAAAVVRTELLRFRERGNCPSLVERATVIDLETLTTRSEKVFRLPWCPFCFPKDAPAHGTGSFALPWLNVGGAG